MRILLKRLPLVALGILMMPASYGQVINENQASNAKIPAAAQGAYAHWAEGHYRGEEAVDPSGYRSPDTHAIFMANSDLPFLYAWVFDTNLPNNTELERIDANLSFGQDSAYIEFQSALSGYPNTDRRASMERRNAPTELNYPPSILREEFDMRGLQIKQPFVGDAGENTLILALPTVGYSGAVLQFAALDEGAAQNLIVDYATNRGSPAWTSSGLAQSEWPLSDTYQLYEFNFSGIEAVNDNPDFRVRIRFSGADMSAETGARVTFNNITLEAQPKAASTEPAPAHRRFAEAQTLHGIEGITTSNTSGANREAGEPDHGAGLGAAGGDLTTNSSIWWTWRADTTERMIFSGDSSSVVQVYSGDSLTNLEPVPQLRAGAGEVLFVALAGETYRLALASPPGEEGQVALTWEYARPPSQHTSFNNADDMLSVICEISGCEMPNEGVVQWQDDPINLSVFMTGPEQSAHSHQLQSLDNQGASLWQADFSAPGAAQSRLIADTEGLPIVITRLSRSNPIDQTASDYYYQVEAHSSGLTRYRITTGGGDARDLLHVHMTVPGAQAHLGEQAEMTVTAPLANEDLRLWLHVDAQARVTARYQKRQGETWEPLGDLLVNTQFAEGSRLYVAREEGVTRMRIETLVDQNLSF